MKKNPYFLVILLLAAHSLTLPAQTDTRILYTHQCNQTTWENSVGRITVDDKYIIASHIRNYVSEFFCINADTSSLAYSEFDLAQGMWVYDFEILGDMVYFCGTYMGMGIIGRFKETEFHTGPTVNYEYVKIPQAVYFHKMVVFDSPDGNVVTVAAVGSDTVMKTNLIATMKINGNQVNYCHKTIPGRDYLYQDIAATDNYIVASGIYNPLNNVFALTFIDKNNISQFVGYRCLETGIIMNNMLYNIEELGGDTVALATIVHNSTGTQFYARVHVVDAPTATIVNTQDVPIINKAPTNEMQYLAESSTLLLLHTTDYPVQFSENSAIYYLKPHIYTPYATSAVYNQDLLLCSLDRFHLDAKYLATGKMKTKEHGYLISKPNITKPTKCLTKNIEKVEISVPPILIYVNEFTMKHVQSFFQPLSSTLTTNSANNHFLDY